MLREQLTHMLIALKDEEQALHEMIYTIERYLALPESGIQRLDARQPLLIENGGVPLPRSTQKGVIAIRRAIGDVLRESGRPMHVKDIWTMAYARGARSSAKRPEAIVALNLSSMPNVVKKGPRIYQWEVDSGGSSAG